METILVPNIILNAKFSLTLQQSRIMREITDALNDFDYTQLKSVKKTLHKTKKGVMISVEEDIVLDIPYKLVLPEGSKNYTAAKDAAKAMVGKTLELPDGKTVISFVIKVISYEFKEGGVSEGVPGMLSLKISHEIIPFFAQLKDVAGGYTPTGRHIGLLSACKYSPKMYDLLSQLGHDGYTDTHLIDMSKLRMKLEVNKKFPGWKDFRKRILEPCQRDLEDTPMAFTWDIPVGGKGGKNGKEVLRILLRLKSVKNKISKSVNQQSVQQVMKVFWRKNITPGTSLSVAATLSPIINTILTYCGADGEKLSQKYQLSEQAIRQIFTQLTPEEICGVISQVKDFNNTEEIFIQKFPCLLSGVLADTFKMKRWAVEQAVTNCTSAEIETVMKIVRKNWHRGDVKKDVGSYTWGVFKRQFPKVYEVKLFAERESVAA